MVGMAVVAKEGVTAAATAAAMVAAVKVVEVMGVG